MSAYITSKKPVPADESPAERETREAKEETLALIEQCDVLMAEHEELRRAHDKGDIWTSCPSMLA